MVRDAQTLKSFGLISLAALIAIALLPSATTADPKPPPKKLTRYQKATKMLSEARSLAKAREYKGSSELFGQFMRVHRTYQDIPLVMIEASGVFRAAGDEAKQLGLLSAVKTMTPFSEYSAEARYRLVMIAYEDAVKARDAKATEKAVEDLKRYIETFPHAYRFARAVETLRDYYIREKKWEDFEKFIEYVFSVYEPASQLTFLHKTILPRIPLPGQLALALKLLDRSIKDVKGTYEEGRLLRAKMRMFSKSGKEEDALKLAKEIRERWVRTPIAESAAVYIADLYKKQGKLDDAIAANLLILKNFAYRGDNPTRVGGVFAMYLTAGKLDDAEKFLRQRDKVDPKPGDAVSRVTRYIQLYVARKDPAGLAKVAAELLSPAQGPQRWKGSLTAIVGHMETLGKTEDALKLLDGICAAKIDPEDRADYLYRKYGILAKEKDKTAFYAVAREYCTQFPAEHKSVAIAAILAAAKGPASRPAINTDAVAEAKRDYDDIMKLVKSDPIEAARLTDKLAKKHPTSLLADNARYACITALRTAGRPREAVEQCNKFVKSHPLHQQAPRIFNLLATLERSEYNYANAAAAYQRLMANWRPTTAYALTQTVSQWISSLNGIKSYGQSIAVVDRMAESVSTPYVKGRIMWLKVHTLQATDPPRHAEAIRTMGRIAKIRGGWTRGRMTWYTVNRVFSKAGDSVGSEAWLKACSTRDPYSTDGRQSAMSLVDRMQGRRDFEGADRAYVRIVKQYPKSSTAAGARYRREWMWWQRAGNHARALKVAEEYLGQRQTRYAKSKAYRRIAGYNGRLKRWKRAITAIDQAMKLWPRRVDMPGLMLSKAEYLFQSRKGKEAVSLIKQVQGRWRDVYWGVRAQNSLAYLYARGKAARLARSTYRSLISKYPSSYQADRAKATR